ncbi:MAG: 4-aminobutyrate--2-oxoglutarate transaminase [Dehalococcoidia bacterium]|nr:4-aminobutyrate--2-oxoglutarate transaminase [Dehalococcoidia bacterium]
MTSIQISTEIPGPRSRELLRLTEEHTPRGLGHNTPIAVAHADGALLTDVDGNTYIDFAGGIGAQNSGHRAPGIVEAIKQQADDYLHLCFMVTLYEPYVRLAEKLNQITPGSFAKKTILFNSGSEGIENAIKIARAYTGRTAVIAFERAFHGRTMLALSLTGQVRPYREGMGPFFPEIYRLPFPYAYRCPDCRESSCHAHSPEAIYDIFRSQVAAESVAAVIVEPVLGEGGFVIPPADYYRGLKAICEEHGILFIADEVQTGFARTGRMFAIENFGVEPDMVVLAKSLSGGTPLSAITGRADVMDAPPVGSLGGTYGGNPIACQAALAAIEVIERDGLIERAREIGDAVQERMHRIQSRHAIVGDVRGLGAMCAMELVRDRESKEPATAETAQIQKACYEGGLIVMKAGAGGNVIRTLMPLVISDEQLDEGFSVLERAIESLSG